MVLRFSREHQNTSGEQIWRLKISSHREVFFIAPSKSSQSVLLVKALEQLDLLAQSPRNPKDRWMNETVRKEHEKDSLEIKIIEK